MSSKHGCKINRNIIFFNKKTENIPLELQLKKKEELEKQLLCSGLLFLLNDDLFLC